MNHTAAARTSYFEVKDEKALKELAEGFGAHAVQKGNQWALLFEDGIPTYGNADTWENHPLFIDEDDDGFFCTVLASLLVEGQGVVLQEVGYDGMRYVTAHNILLAPDGTTECISLADETSFAMVSDIWIDLKFGEWDY